jgi:cytohesin
VVQQLVAAGNGVQHVRVNYAETTPLHAAAEAECPTLVAALLQAGADPGSTTPQGYSVLHAAATGGNPEVVQLVLAALGSSRAAELVRALGRKFKHEPRFSPLHMAAYKGHLEVAQALVAAGADLEQQAEGQEGLRSFAKHAALQVALKEGKYHLVPLLLTPGNVNVSGGDVPLHLAAVMPSCDTLMGRQKSRQPLIAGATHALATLLAAGANVSAKDEEGRTALEAAAAEGQPEVLQLLLHHHQQQLLQQQAAATPQSRDPQSLPSVLQRLGAHALAWGNNRTWCLVLNLVAGTLGEEGVTSLWGSLKQQLLQGEESFKPGGWMAQSLAAHRADFVSQAWARCWVAACKDLAAQRPTITERLEQLVIAPQQQQQQRQQRWQRGDAEAQHATEGAVRIGSAGPFHLTYLMAIAARGDMEEVQAAVARMCGDRAQGLATAAAAAGGAGHWGLCVELLREMVMLDGGMHADAKDMVHAAVQEAVRMHGQQQQQRQQQSGPIHEYRWKRQAAAGLCDALVADWLSLRQQLVRERRRAVVAAVTTARGSDSASM